LAQYVVSFSDMRFRAAALRGFRPVVVLGVGAAVALGLLGLLRRLAHDAFIRTDTAFLAAALMGFRPVLVTVVGLVVA